MTSRPMPHSFATFADEWGSPSSPLTQHETLRRYEFSLDFPNPAAAVSMAISRPWTVFDTSVPFQSNVRWRASESRSRFSNSVLHAVSEHVPWSHWHAISTSSDPASLQA
jgi:hypothetical protein